MTAPQPLRDPVPAIVLDELQRSQFECVSFEQLSSRPTNYVYRGYLKAPFQSPVGTTITSIVIKHAAPGDPLPSYAERADFDRALAEHLSQGLSVSFTDNLSIQYPSIYSYLKNSNTVIWHDVHDGRMFKGMIFTPDTTLLPLQYREPVGFQLGRWIRAFHDWTSAPAQAPLRAKVPEKDPTRKVKWISSFGTFIDVISMQPDVVAGFEETMYAIQDVMAAEFALPYSELDENWGLVHGDLWLGNVLFEGESWRDGPGEVNKLWIVDFEYCQILHRSVDLGQTLGDMYERKAYRNTEDGLPIMRGLINGYGKMSEDMAFRILLYVGVHVIKGYKRQPSQGPNAIDEEAKVAGLAHGRDILLRAWSRDKAFFKDGVFAALFTY